jgi:acyl-homoserine lactone acylase PvdQ
MTVLLTSLVACIAPEDPEVMNVFPPGQGTNLTSEPGQSLPESFTSELPMFTALPGAAQTLSDADLAQYYKPMDFAPVPEDDISVVTNVRPDVRIVRDKQHNVPRVYGKTRAAAMFGVGYARAQDRLWQMEVNRHTARASLATLLGRGDAGENLASDLRIFRVLDYSEAEYLTMFDKLCVDYGEPGKQACEDLTRYVEGINAYIALTVLDPTFLPVEFRRRSITPREWRVTDEIAYTAYAHVRSGGRAFSLRELGNSNLLQQLRQHMGRESGDRMYSELRNAIDPETPTVVKAEDQDNDPASRLAGVTAATALIDLDSFVPRDVLASGEIEEGQAVALNTPGPLPHKSNALLVGARLSSTGHPLSVQGPQDGYQVPHADDWEVVVEAPDYRVRGSLEWHGPYPYNGARGHNFVFSGTAQFGDQYDTFVERLCTPDGSDPTSDSMHYRYRGECIAFEVSESSYAILGEDTAYVCRSERSVHGPIIGRATVDSQPVALAQARSTFMQEERGLPALAEVFAPSKVNSAADFIRIMSRMPRQLAFYYVDRHDIAFVNPGLVPLRLREASGELPVWGTGEWDWQDFEPTSRRFASIAPPDLPQVINPASGVIAGWNNQPVPGWIIADHVWDSGPLNRVALLEESTKALAAQRLLSISDVVRIHTLAGITDGRASLFYPIVRRLLPADVVADAELATVLHSADAWVAGGALRQDADNDGYLESAQAIAVLDAWWPLLIRAIAEPVLGTAVIEGSGGRTNNFPPLDIGPDFGSSAWFSYLARDLRQLMGEEVARPFSVPLCGAGDLDACRLTAQDSLRAALHAAAGKYRHAGGAWQIPVTCDGCLQTEYRATGDAPDLNPTLWQSRPTFEIVSAFR